METNPIFWLELRQARRNHSLFLLFGVGCLMGFYLLHRVFVPYSGYGSLETIMRFIPYVFYPLGTLLIPLSTGLKLASQQVDEDLLLKTPLSASRILWGKLDVALIQMLCLHLPTLPGLLLLFSIQGFDWFLGSVAVAVITLSATLTALGFMAGARTTLLRAVMVCLAGLFVFGLAVVSSILAGFIMTLFTGGHGPPSRDSEFVAIASAFLFAFFMSCLIFRMGIAFLARDKNLAEILVGSVITAFLAFFFYLVGCGTMIPHPTAVAAMLIPWCAFSGSPLIAMVVINNLDGARGVAPPVELFNRSLTPQEPDAQRSGASG